MNKFTKIFVGALAAVAIFASAASAAYTHTGLLKMGMTSSQVMSLQQALNANGFVVATSGAGSLGMESMYFGAKTKAAVMAFQSAKGLGADGVVGSMTGAALAGLGGGSGVYPAGCSSSSGFSTTTGQPCSSASLPTGCTSTTGFSPVTGMSCSGGSTPTGALAGTDGSISDVDTLTSYNDEEVGEGQDNVKVAGFEVEASNDGDIAIKSIKVKLDSTGNTGSTHLDDYIDGVSIWMGSTKIGSASADDFSENSDIYTKTITVSNAVVRADKIEKFYISVDAVNTFDSTDIATTNDSWTVAVESIRFEDGSGVVTTEDSIGDLGDDGATIGTDGGTDGDGVPMNFVSFGTAADTDLTISTDSDTPEAGIVMVDDSTDTEDVVLLKGKMKLDGTSDVLLDEFPVSFSPVGANINVIATSLKLKIGGEEFTESVPSIADGATASVTFDNLDITIDAGDTVEFEVLADIADLDGSTFAEGDSLEADVTASNRALIDAENEEGDQLSDSSEKSGTANGEAQEFRTEGISVSFVSATTDTTAGNSANDDTGTFTLKFKVTANGNAVYLDPTFVATTVAGTSAIGSTVQVQRSGVATTGGTSLALENLTDDDTEGSGNYKIEDGQSETFEVTVSAALPSAGSAGLYRAVMNSIGWNVTDSASVYSTYTSNLDSYKTSYISLN